MPACAYMPLLIWPSGGGGNMGKTIKMFVVAFVIAFAAQVVIDLPAVKSYVQEESDRARMEMYHLRVRYDKAERGM